MNLTNNLSSDFITVTRSKNKILLTPQISQDYKLGNRIVVTPGEVVTERGHVGGFLGGW